MSKIVSAVLLIFSIAICCVAQNRDGDWLSGVWEGTGHQVDTGSTWTMRLTVSGDKYLVDYPSLKCGGNWRLVSMKLEEATFIERLQYGVNNCVDDGNVFIERLNSKQIGFRWSHSNSTEVIAYVILRRKLTK